MARTTLRNNIWDWFLCLAISTSLAITLQTGFNVRETPTMYVITGACCALMLIAAFASKRSLLLTLASFVGVSIVLLAVAGVLSTGASLTADVPENYLIPALVVIASSVLTYGLSRRLSTTVLLFIVAFFSCAFLQFLYKENHLIACIVCLFSCIAMLAYRNFETSISSANVAAKTTRTAGFASALVLSLAIVGFAGGLYLAVVEPLNPPAATIKLIQEFRKLPEILAHSPLEVNDEVDTKLKSSKTDDQHRTTTYEKPGETGPEIPARSPVPPDNIPNDKTESSFDKDSDDEGFDPLSLGKSISFPIVELIIASIFLLIVLSILTKLLLRRRWYSRVCSRKGPEQVKELYNFFISRFSKIGLEKRAAQTPMEFAVANELTFKTFAGEDACPYSALTRTFQDVTYGEIEPDEAQLGEYHDYYKSFYKNCSRFIGRLSYMKKFFFM